jgi:hypothetical protein
MSLATTKPWLRNVTMSHSLLLETKKGKILKHYHFLDSKNGQNKKKCHGKFTPLQQSFKQSNF